MLNLSPHPGDLDAVETVSADQLRELQLERLRWSVHHAYDNVVFYRRSFDVVGVHPDDVKSLEDLAKLPFTTKRDLRENYPFGMFAVLREQVSRIHASSGTTGRPTVVGSPVRTSTCGPPWWPAACAPPAAPRSRPAQRLWLRPVHRRSGRPRRRGEAGVHGGTGRTDDVIILRAVNLFPTHIEELILAVPEQAPHFQCVLSRTDELDKLTVRVEHRPGAGTAAEAAGTRLLGLIENSIGVAVAVEVLAPNSVERSAGKMRRVVDDRPAR